MFQPPSRLPHRLPILAPAAARVLLPCIPARWLASGRAFLDRLRPQPLTLLRAAPQHAGATFVTVFCACARDAGPPLWRGLRPTSARFPRPARRASRALPLARLAHAHGTPVGARMFAPRFTGSASHSPSAPPLRAPLGRATRPAPRQRLCLWTPPFTRPPTTQGSRPARRPRSRAVTSPAPPLTPPAPTALGAPKPSIRYDPDLGAASPPAFLSPKGGKGKAGGEPPRLRFLLFQTHRGTPPKNQPQTQTS